MVLALRDLEAEIEELALEKSYTNYDKIDELILLKKKLDSIVPFQTLMKDYNADLERYEKLRKELLRDD